MALTEAQVVDNITVTVGNHIQVRTDTVVYRDGVEISRTYHRHVLVPGDRINEQDLRVRKIATVLWDPPP